MKQIFYLKSFRVLAVLLAAAFAFLSFYHIGVYSRIVSPNLVSGLPSGLALKKFDKTRDEQFILDCFKNNRYWLTNNPNFSEQFMMDHMSPSFDPAFFNKENIVLLFAQNEPVGFGAYHMKSFYEGFIHFLCIDKQFRGKGYAPIIMEHMMSQLKKMGAKFLKVCTRFNNLPARALYRKLGFKEHDKEADSDFVYFSMTL